MVDVENEILTKIATALRAVYDSISIYGEYVKSPATFPAVTIEEKTNSVFERTSDSSSVENHATVMYEINVYSNKKTGKKSECKEIFSIIDSEFAEMGFTRTMKEPIPNMDDATIYRILGRYTAVVSTNNIVYRR